MRTEGFRTPRRTARANSTKSDVTPLRQTMLRRWIFDEEESDEKVDQERKTLEELKIEMRIATPETLEIRKEAVERRREEKESRRRKPRKERRTKEEIQTQKEEELSEKGWITKKYVDKIEKRVRNLENIVESKRRETAQRIALEVNRINLRYFKRMSKLHWKNHFEDLERRGIDLERLKIRLIFDPGIT